MNASQPNIQGRRETLEVAYLAERARIASLSGDSSAPDGDFEHPVFGAGDVFARALIIGEAPGGEEAACGMPFVGKAGKQLGALLGSIALDRNDVYITNVVKYRPVVRGARTVRNRTPIKGEVAGALPLLELELNTIAPSVVVTLGNTPLYAVTALFGGAQSTIGALHGRPRQLRATGEAPALFPLYHPASGIYNRSLVPVMEADIRALAAFLAK